MHVCSQADSVHVLLRRLYNVTGTSSATGIRILFRTMYVFVQHYWNLV